MAQRQVKRKPLYPGWGSGQVAYVKNFSAYSVVVIERPDLNIGDKIILPESCLSSISKLRIPFPLIFEVRNVKRHQKKADEETMEKYRRLLVDIYKLANPNNLKKVDGLLRKYAHDPHGLYLKVCDKYKLKPKSGLKQKKFKGSRAVQYCSVVEFSSPREDEAYLPHWMMENLGLSEGDTIEIQSQFDIPKGNFCKLQPLDPQFLEVMTTMGMKEILENSLRLYSALSKNERIVVEFNHRTWDLIVKETRPNEVINILGSTDLEVEFAECETGNRADAGTDSGSAEYRSNSISDDLADNSASDNANNTPQLASVATANQSGSDLAKVHTPVLGPNGHLDGKALQELGIPLDWNDQQQLAVQLQAEARQHTIDQCKSELPSSSPRISLNEWEETTDTVEGTETSISTGVHDSEDEDEKASVLAPEDDEETPIGPDDVACKNCGRFVNAMSITMHELHCQRNYTRCQTCQETIHKNDKETHDTEMHSPETCICGEDFHGTKALQTHKTDDCPLRTVTCNFCDAECAAVELDTHQEKCKIQETKCEVCGVEYIRFKRAQHECGVPCPLCKEWQSSSNLMLHMISDCNERRAQCKFCKMVRKTSDMEDHMKYCGSRSERCETCRAWVTLMNMEEHIQSNCGSFSNKQRSKNSIDDELAQSLSKLDLDNPYLDTTVLDASKAGQSIIQPSVKENLGPSLSAFLAKDSNTAARNAQIRRLSPDPSPVPRPLSDADEYNHILCPHCTNEERWISNVEDFQIHIATDHPSMIDHPLTQSCLQSSLGIYNSRQFGSNANANANRSKPKSSKKKKKAYRYRPKRQPTETLSPDKSWACPSCTYQNALSKRRCLQCSTFRPDVAVAPVRQSRNSASKPAPMKF